MSDSKNRDRFNGWSWENALDHIESVELKRDQANADNAMLIKALKKIEGDWNYPILIARKALANPSPEAEKLLRIRKKAIELVKQRNDCVLGEENILSMKIKLYKIIDALAAEIEGQT